MMDRVIRRLMTMAGCIWSLGRGAAELERPETERERGESKSKVAPDDRSDHSDFGRLSQALRGAWS